ncbi:hypothetical protein IFM89_006397 [Coptis chinensis]|uniref:BED-type domain-containing protein n=1 Tax=Coptis chinensis TaxID=261450 RepID=A0A835LQJ4_9MAGN|nr:hypothetical protein IFM89_006397 [Coptis chinensis]
MVDSWVKKTEGKIVDLAVAEASRLEMSSSRASNEPVASAATTTSMKRKLNDMAWEWGECRDPNNKKFVWYTLCDKRISGGINRLKEHLVHKKGNVTSCLKRQDEDDDVVEEQDICSGGGNRNQSISIGRRKAIDNVRGPLDQLLTTDNMKQSTLDKNNPQKQVLKKKAWLCITKWAYEVGLPFNAVRPPNFTKMIHAIGEYGREKRFKERLADSDSDHILLKEIDKNDDCIIPSETQFEDFVVEGDDLTWKQVRAARGADIDVGPSTRNRNRNSVTIRDEADDEEDEVDFEAHTGGGEQGEGN